MKKLFKKNQIIITLLALMIATAGYMNYSGKLFPFMKKSEKTTQASKDTTKDNLLDISQEDEETPGEAVLTNSDAKAVVSEAKVNREQSRSKNTETLQKIIDNKELSSNEKQEAVNQLAVLTKRSEQEMTIETLLSAKGFVDAVVTLSDDSADVVVNSEEITDTNRAQIEDIVTRKSEVSAENIVITPIRTK